MQAELNHDQRERLSAVFEAIGIKGELQRTAKRHLRTTPEYEQARNERRARAWLEDESRSMAEALYEVLVTRELES